MPYVVESRVTNQDGSQHGTARIYVATEERAKAVAAAKPGATYREVTLDAMPDAARENLERAARET